MFFNNKVTINYDTVYGKNTIVVLAENINGVIKNIISLNSTLDTLISKAGFINDKAKKYISNCENGIKRFESKLRIINKKLEELQVKINETTKERNTVVVKINNIEKEKNFDLLSRSSLNYDVYDDYLKDLDKITKKYDDMLVKYNGMLKSFDAKLEVYLKEKKILEEKKAICIDCIKRLETVKTALESIQNLMEYCIKYINSTKEEIVRLKDDLNSHLEKLYKYKKSLEKLEEDFKEIKFKRSHQIDYLEDEYIRQDKTYGNIKNIDFNDFLKRIKETFKNYVNDIEAYEKLIQNISSWDDDNRVKVYEIIKTIKLTLKNYVVESFRLFGIELSYLFDIFYNYRALYNDIDDKFWNVLNCYNIRNNYQNIREFKYKDAINTEIPDFKIHNNKG